MLSNLEVLPEVLGKDPRDVVVTIAQLAIVGILAEFRDGETGKVLRGEPRRRISDRGCLGRDYRAQA